MALPCAGCFGGLGAFLLVAALGGPGRALGRLHPEPRLPESG
ncbi:MULTISPECIES: hypothetical protein [Streptomyces]|nr:MULTISPECIES: hypothetical protein [unclassified Streptomyces]SED77331.1 hypothetical protein SAMN05216482_8881 [Streptomyces sp. PAN_FS17]SEE73363.1 hypothetical protein SAMN05428938_8388 [Streptomyces sp. KS_5]